MNILTHGLASLALARAGWPRAPKQLWIIALLAGAVADIDSASMWWGAAAYLRWHHTYTHSFFAALVIAVAFATGYRFLARDVLRARFSIPAAFALALAAGCLHLLLDACGWEGATLLRPLSARRFALDLVVNLDPWIVVLLLGALLFPELLHLVSAEIGARDKRPRGRIGALIGFALIIIYVGFRANFHSNVIALLESRTYRGEIAKRTGAFPEALSPVSWHGIIETERALHELTVMVGPVSSFDPESADTLFKPEPSPALEVAGKTAAAEAFLRRARFPKATVQTTGTETRVELRDLLYDSIGETNRQVIAVIQLDTANRIVSQELVWAKGVEEQ